MGAKEIERLKKRLAADSGNVDVAPDLDLAMQRLDGHAERLRKTVVLVNGLGMNTSEYRQHRFETTGEITTGYGPAMRLHVPLVRSLAIPPPSPTPRAIPAG